MAAPTARTARTSGVVARASAAVAAPTGEGLTVEQMLAAQAPAIAAALPQAMGNDGPVRFTRMVMTTVKASPQLMQCDPMTLLAAAMVCAQLGLDPGGPLGHAYLVPYQRKVQFILGYKGIIELVRRSGTLDTMGIEAREVYERDEFDVDYGLHPKLVHRPYFGDDRGRVILYYGVAVPPVGRPLIHVMTRADIDRARAFSASGNSGPWKDHFDAMARKTVIRRMAPWLPLSPIAAAGIAHDETVRGSFSRDMLDGPAPIPDERDAITVGSAGKGNTSGVLALADAVHKDVAGIVGDERADEAVAKILADLPGQRTRLDSLSADELSDLRTRVAENEETVKGLVPAEPDPAKADSRGPEQPTLDAAPSDVKAGLAKAVAGLSAGNVQKARNWMGTNLSAEEFAELTDDDAQKLLNYIKQLKG